ncbi:conserved hypothetical protein [Chelatococcus asaccharovorans]|nr:conserved hypothetical protein [Chelatococcus asaccharovorans]
MVLSNRSEYINRLETIAREAYDRCHRDDSFDDMRRRARFSKEDRGLLGDWLAFARQELQSAGNDQAGAPRGRNQ